MTADKVPMVTAVPGEKPMTPRWRGGLALLPLCAFVGFLFLADLLFLPETQRLWWWAGLQVFDFALPYRLLAVALPIVLVLLPPEGFLRVEAMLRSWWRRGVEPFRSPYAAVPAVIVMLWLLRSTRLVIGDSEFYITDVIPREAMSLRGMMLNYDSIGTTILYSRGYRYANLFLAMDPLTWYNVAGLACLGSFFGWIWWNRKKDWALAGPAALALVFAGNWSQATLGAPEHYGQVFLCTLAFAILAVEALRRRAPLWWPCLAYSIGAFFHLMIGCLFPALLYLIWKCWPLESRQQRALAIYALFLPAFLTGYICYFFGFDLSFLSGTNSARGKLIPFLGPDHPYSGAVFHYTTFDRRHLAHIVQEIFLMGWPGLVALAAGAAFFGGRFLRLTPPLAFLLWMLGGTLLLNLLWNPDLQFWRDQDLFSIVGLPLCLLGAWALATPEARQRLDDDKRRQVYLAALVAGLLWRVPVVLWHGVLAPTWLDPEAQKVVWPFDL